MLENVGGGKTAYCINYILDIKQKNPDFRVFANLHLKGIKNFNYIPFLFIPISKIDNCIILIDDAYTLSLVLGVNLMGLFGIVVNMSRKKNVHVIITCQDYTHAPPKLRNLANGILSPTLFLTLKCRKCGFESHSLSEHLKHDKNHEKYDFIQDYMIIDKSMESLREERYYRPIEQYEFFNPIERASHHYDTFEVVRAPTEYDLLAEIVSQSYNFRDLDANLITLTKDRRRHNKLLAKLAEQLGFAEPANYTKYKGLL